MTTLIEWTDTTWNPVTGCDRVASGCDNCYALALSRRLKAMGVAKYQSDGSSVTSGPGFGVQIHPSALSLPKTWQKPRMVFVNSMSDLFHPKVPISFIQEIFDVIHATPRHTYQILTKRAHRMARVAHRLSWPPNVWMGTTVEDAAAVNRITDLSEAPVPVKFLSCEPLLEALPLLPLEGISWMIVGGESGPKARPVDPAWVVDLRDQAVSADVAFFFKQWGGRTPKARGRLLQGRTWDEYPVARTSANQGGAN